MKVVVCVKHVPDGHVRVDPTTGRVDRTGSGDVNRMDLHAIEEALRVRAETEGEVVAVSMGPEPAAESVRTALALGVDRGVLVRDDRLAGSDVVATSAVVARVLERERPDLVLFGQQTSDGGGAMLWAAVAEWWHRPSVSQATALEVAGDRARITRQTERGDEVVEAPLPVLVAVTDAINEPRYASLRGMMAAKRKPLEQLGLDDLGIDPASIGTPGARTEVLAVGTPPARHGGRRIDDEASAAQAIVDYLVERELI